ncbi:uncharacterized protein V1510DRAFT_425147 [Dipodascopsis tothii]|uniref:uncharacterized protein n=1 Tax=Dipodascopsis tothii TaxID=44089 RepID=UPI0034CE193B
MQNNRQGRSNKNFHVAHRRTPSELTPLMMEQLALQQQMEFLQVQQQQILAQQQQFAQSGLLSSQHAPNSQLFPGMPAGQGSNGYNQMPSSSSGFGHRRTQSSTPNFQMMNASSVSNAFGATGLGNANGSSNSAPVYDMAPPSGPPSNRSRGLNSHGHTRRHSLALPEAKRAAQLAQTQRSTNNTSPLSFAGNRSHSPVISSGYQFPPKPVSSGPSTVTGESSFHGNSNINRFGSTPSVHSRSQSLVGDPKSGAIYSAQQPNLDNFSFGSLQSDTGPGPLSHGQDRRHSQIMHGRSGSRNFDGDWRSKSISIPAANMMHETNSHMSMNQQQFIPGHHSRRSLTSSSGSVSSPYIGQGQFGQQNVLPMFSGQQLLNPQLSVAPQSPMMMTQSGYGPNSQMSASTFLPKHGSQIIMQQQQQQQQRKSLFLPYLPQASIPSLVTEGRLVTGVLRVNKKNRSDAYVSSELIDSDIYICGSKDRNRALEGDVVAVELLTVDEVWGSRREKEEKKKRKEGEEANSGSLQRRGSLHTRPIQKKNDDVEVEGQGLLLVEEDELSDETKPLYAGHIVAIIERTPGQLYSGTLGILRPSSQAAKEKQESEEKERGIETSNHAPVEKPKIVWFKPTDKRVPLIAIPTEQAPKDFIENHKKYANTLFVASIKRWPITSLHPFGMLTEELGSVGVHSVELNAILRDNSFVNDTFSDSIINNVNNIDDTKPDVYQRRTFDNEFIMALDCNDSETSEQAVHLQRLSANMVRIGVHIADVAHYIKPNSPLDREAKNRGTSVFLVKRSVDMLPKQLLEKFLSFEPHKKRMGFSVVFDYDLTRSSLTNVWIGKSIVETKIKLTYNDIQSVYRGAIEDLKTLKAISEGLYQKRLHLDGPTTNYLHLLRQLEDENVPVETNIYERKLAVDIIDELLITANALVASKLVQELGDKAILRRHMPPKSKRINEMVRRLHALNQGIDASSSESLQKSLLRIKDFDVLQGLETIVLKAFSPAKYVIPEKTSDKQRFHYLLNLPAYTHFTSPTRRYADILVHRQLESVLYQNEPYSDPDTLLKLVDHCNEKKIAARTAQEQSIHLFLSEAINNLSSETGQLIRDAIIINCHESSFDVLVPKFGIEKRVHCDQLPLRRVEFNRTTRLLELYWEEGVDSATYVPDNEKEQSDKTGQYQNSRAVAAASEQAKNELDRKMMEISSLCIEDETALFDDDDEMIESVMPSSSHSKSLPPSPKKGSTSNLTTLPQRTTSLTGISHIDDNYRSPLDTYLEDVVIRREGGECIQEIRELQHVAILLRAEIGKSLPCLTVRTLNPFA